MAKDVEQLMQFIKSHTMANNIDLSKEDLGKVLLESVARLVNTSRDFLSQIQLYDQNYSTEYQSAITSLKACISAGASLNTKYDGWTLLHYAAKHEDEGLVEYLSSIDGFQAACEVKEDEDLRTPLHIACTGNSTKIVRILADGNRAMLLMDNQSNGQNKQIKLEQIPLSIAIKENKLANVQLLAETTSKSLQALGLTELLKFAVVQGDTHIEIVRHLMTISAYKSNAHLLSNYKHGNNDQIVTLLETHKNAIRTKELEFIRAAKDGQNDRLEQLLAEGVNPYYRDSTDKSALLYLAERTDIMMCAKLIHAGDAQYQKDDIKSLTQEQKIELGEKGLALLMRSPKAISSFLMAKTLIARRANNQVNDINQIYEELCDIGDSNTLFSTYLRPLVEVLEFVPNLSINYDPTLSNSSRVDPLSELGTRGIFIPGDARICIGGNNSYPEVMGTCIHEITHLVCDKVWNNSSNPYINNSKEEKEFKHICGELEEKYLARHNSLDIVLQRVFAKDNGTPVYTKDKHPKELIVRVPQMIAEYQGEGIRKLQEQAPELLKFYQEYVLPKCIGFIKQGYKSKVYEVTSNNLDKLFYSLSKQFKKCTVTKHAAEKNYRLIDDIDNIIHDLEVLKDPKMQLHLANFLNVRAYYNTQNGVVSGQTLAYSEKAKAICERGIADPGKLTIQDLCAALSEKDPSLPILYVSTLYTFGRMYFYNRSIENFSQHDAKSYITRARDLADHLYTTNGMRSLYQILTRRTYLYFNLEKDTNLAALREAESGYTELLNDNEVYLDVDNDGELVNLAQDSFHKIMCGRQLISTYIKLATLVTDMEQKSEYYQKAQNAMHVVLEIAQHDPNEKERIASLYNQIGCLLLATENPNYDPEKSKKYFDYALKTESSKNSGNGKVDYPLADAHKGLAMVFQAKKQFPLSKEHALKSLEIRQKMSALGNDSELSKAKEWYEKLLYQIDKMPGVITKWREFTIKSKADSSLTHHF